MSLHETAATAIEESSAVPYKVPSGDALVDEVNHSQRPSREVSLDAQIEVALQRLADGEQQARGELIGLVCERMRRMAHRMLGRFPVVRRWSDTDDIVQNASLRLWKSLDDISPPSVRAMLGLVGLQIRRELLDLAKHFSRPSHFAANHDSNAGQPDVGGRTGSPEPPAAETSAESLDRWSKLHEAAASLPEAERELFHLVWYVGLQQAEAARLLGCSTRTVKRRWESVKALLRQVFPDSPPD